MFLEGFLCLVLIVLAAYTYDDAPVLEFLHPHLEFGERLADAKSVTKLDALQSVVAYHTAPEGVVEVEDYTFLELALYGADDVHHPRRHIRDGVEGEYHLRGGIHHRVEHHVASQLVLQAGDVTDKKVGKILRQAHQFVVHLAHLPGERRLHLVGVAAKHRVLNLGIVEVYHLRPGGGADAAHEVNPPVRQCRLFPGRQQTVVFVPLVCGLEHHDVFGIEGVEVARGIHELPLHLVVLSLEQINMDTYLHAPSLDGGRQKLRGGITQQGDFNSLVG